MRFSKNLTLSDYHKEMLVLMLAAHERAAYEWEQYVSISQAAGVREDQFIAIAEHRFDDAEAFTGDERVLPRFGKAILDEGKAPTVLFKHALEHFSVQELADAVIVLGYYRMLSGTHSDLQPSQRYPGGRKLGQGVKNESRYLHWRTRS